MTPQRWQLLLLFTVTFMSGVGLWCVIESGAAFTLIIGWLGGALVVWVLDETIVNGLLSRIGMHKRG